MLLVLAICTSCKKPRSDIGAVLFKETKNRTYKNVDSAAYYKVFREVLAEKKDSIVNPLMLTDFYAKNEFEPYFIVNFTTDQRLKSFVSYLGGARAHGLNPEKFHYTRLKTLTDRLYQKKGIRKVEDAYREIAETELFAADALLTYSKSLRYGVVNPRKIFARYYMRTDKPDSAFYNSILRVTDIKALLDTLPPKDTQYRTLQAAIRANTVYPGISSEETKAILAMNLERLRWRNKPRADRYVWVNIADFSLKYVDGGKTALAMKVCVGEGPEGEPQLADYDEDDSSVRPFDHSTPQLSSEINSVQVNPIWNIPESIAKNEISRIAAKDPYYLSNQGIRVYSKSGGEIDADQIDWSSANAGDYSFKQSPGEINALGKIKFLFPNGSSVYLHDTPAQKPFSLTNRAVSHGCVRLEKPLELAQAVFGTGAKYETVKKEMSESNPSAKDIVVSPKVPVYLDYQTAFLNDAGQIKIQPDVYKLDRVLYKRMGNWLAFR